MRDDFLQPQTVAALHATQFGYSAKFTVAAAAVLGGTPNSQGSGAIGIQGAIHFFTEALFLKYPTTYSEDGVLLDDGQTRLTLQLQLGTVIPMFQNPVSLDLCGVPGRMPVGGSTTPIAGVDPAPGQPPHIAGWPFHFFIPQSSPFTHTFSNTSNVAAEVEVFWRGWNIPQAWCPDLASFWDIVKSCQAAPATE